MNNQEKNDNATETQEEQVAVESEVLREEYRFAPSALCKYKQRGPYLVCVSCEVQHAVWVGMNKVMVGEDSEGKPILKSRFFS